MRMVTGENCLLTPNNDVSKACKGFSTVFGSYFFDSKQNTYF